MDGIRTALIVASDHYTDPRLGRLRAPSTDAEALAGVLRNPAIGGFEVHTLLNQPVYEVNLAVEEFFADRRPDDLLLLHFSCHGVKNEAGELHLATTNTLLRRLGSTAVSARFVMGCMDRCRSRRMVLLLDCCHAGAFERGMTARAGGEVDIEAQFGGRGRAVITASRAMEYAFEGDELADAQELGPSVFTGALVEGLETGDADRDQDGMVGLEELYDYVYDRVRVVTPNQTPGKWILGVEGELYIARRARPVTTPAPLPPELLQLLGHPYAATRAGVVEDLARLLHDRHAGLALAARQALEHLTRDDSRRVSAAATAALGEQGTSPPPEPPPPEPAPPEPPPAPPRLALSATAVDFGRLVQHGTSPEHTVTLGNAGGGTLNARAATQASWLKLRQVGDRLSIGVATVVPGRLDDVITVHSDGGSAAIRVTATVDPHPVAASPRPHGASPGLERDPRGSYEGYKLANWWQRMGAGLLDLLLAVAAFFVGGQVVFMLTGGDGLSVSSAVLAFVASWFCNSCYLAGRTGRSLGKRALGLKLVGMADKQPIGTTRAFRRGLAHALDILPLGMGFLRPLFDVRRQTIADRIAETIVVSARDPTGVAKTS